MTKTGSYQIRLATRQDVSNVRRLVNEAYQELAQLGLNYTATYQDETVTLERMEKGRCFLLIDAGQIIGTIIFYDHDHLQRQKKCAYLGQFGIDPRYKRKGLGTLLMNYVEELAAKEGYESIQLDTAKPATHLVDWYLKRKYQIIAEEQWEGKTYQSWIFEKEL